MTTPIVPSISDEQLAELEQSASHEFFSDDDDAAVMFGELLGLIARLRAAEADAKRYRFLCDPQGSDEDYLADAMNKLNAWADKSEVDQAVDAAMEPKP